MPGSVVWISHWLPGMHPVNIGPIRIVVCVMGEVPKRVAWISHFPVEWLDGAPAEVTAIPRAHPAPWQRVLAAELARLYPELEIHAIALRRTFPRTMSFRMGNLHVHLLKTRGGLRATTLFWYDTLLIWRVLRRIKPDLIHAWGTEWCAPWVAKRLGYRFMVTMQGIFTWLRSIGWHNVHGRVYEDLSAYCERRVLKHARLVTAESRFAVGYLQDRLGLNNVWQIEHAPLQHFFTLRRVPAAGELRLLYVGYVSDRKGCGHLLMALDRLRAEFRFRLLLVGKRQQPFFDSVWGSVSSELRGRVAVEESLSAAEVGKELERATIFVFPTLADNSPNAVKEAAVVGVPVVATRVGGIPDYIFDGRNGILCEPGNVDALANALRVAFRHDLFRRGVVDPEAHSRVREYLAPERMARAFWNAYCEVCGVNAGARSRLAPVGSTAGGCA